MHTAYEILLIYNLHTLIHILMYTYIYNVYNKLPYTVCVEGPNTNIVF